MVSTIASGLRGQDLFPRVLSLHDYELIPVSGFGHLVLRCFGSTMEMKGVAVYARREGDLAPLPGSLEFSLSITQDYEIEWSRKGECRDWDSGLTQEVEIHCLEALANIKSSDPIGYMFLVKDRAFGQLSAFRRERRRLDDAADERAYSNPRHPEIAPKIEAAKARLEAFDGENTGRMAQIEAIWRGIIAWSEVPRRSRQISIGDLVDQMLEHAREQALTSNEPAPMV